MRRVTRQVVRRSRLVDPALAKLLSEEGIARADAAVKQEVRDLFDRTIYELAERQQFISSDDVWQRLGVIPSHGAASALGAAFRRSSSPRNRVVWKAGTTTTGRPTQHQRQIRLWQSALMPDTHICVCTVCGESIDAKGDSAP